MKKYLNIAAKAWAGATLNIQKFADAYVYAVLDFGDEAAKSFAAAYPMFGEREWRRLTLIGNGELLPQFFFKSDYFVGKLLKMSSSMRIQRALVGASNDGRIRVDRGHGPEKASLADLTKKEERALVMLLSEENEKLTDEALKTKYRILISKVNKSGRKHRAAWEMRVVGGRTVAHFNRACTMEREDLEEVLKRMKRGHRAIGATRPSRDILDEMADEIVMYSSLRDDEWEFEENHGNRDFWDGKTCKEHDELLGDIQASRNRLTELVREATGDEKVYV